MLYEKTLINFKSFKIIYSINGETLIGIELVKTSYCIGLMIGFLGYQLTFGYIRKEK